MNRQHKTHINNENSESKTIKQRLKERLLDLQDMADVFRVSPGTITNWTNIGLFKVIPLHGRTYYDAYDIVNVLEAYKQKRVPGENRGRKKKGK